MAEYVTEWGESVTDFTVREEVVRCRDCEMHETYTFVGNEQHVCKRFSEGWHVTDEDGYCAWATRKEGE